MGTKIINANSTPLAISLLFIVLRCKTNSAILETIIMLLIRIHKLPPRTPVYSYHCTHSALKAKPFPSVSHGHDISVLKYKYSKVIHQKTSAYRPTFLSDHLRDK